jgi:hypothetical protein
MVASQGTAKGNRTLATRRNYSWENKEEMEKVSKEIM